MKKPGKNGGGKKTAAPANAGDKRAARNVEKLKQKLSSALDDPQMREQILRAMRSLMYEDKT